jgi:glutathione peroxidase
MKMTWIILAIVLAALVVVGLMVRNAFSADMSRARPDTGPSIYDLQVTSLEGEDVDLGQYRGTVTLVVNTASKCGLTPQYEGLEALHRELADQGFSVLGFPANDFLGQEPGSAEEIIRFCTTNYNVTFPLFAKASVKGDERQEVFRRLTVELEEPTWNFTKYVVGKDGRVVARFGPRTDPGDPRLRDTIERALAAGI